MSEIENKTIIKDDDEISLIDLFSVIIRYRLLIICGTVAAAVIAVLHLFVYPIIFPKTLSRDSTVEYRVSVTPVPATISMELPAKFTSLKNVVNSEFNDVFFLVKEISKNNPFRNDNDKELFSFEFNSFVKDLIKDDKLQIETVPVRDEVIIKMTIPEENIGIATDMVDSMIDSVNTSIKNVFLREVEKVAKTKLETYQEITNTFSENSNITDAQAYMLTVRQVDEFLKNYTCISERVFEPFVIIQPRGRVKKLAIITLAAFFLFIFIAFLINAIKNIKNDPEASSKLKAAWDNGKIVRK